MTEKLFYSDPQGTEFNTRLISQELRETPKGHRWIVRLEASGFYPGGGGQPADRGTLNNREVLSLSTENDEILHHLSAPLEEGEPVFGRIEPLHRRHYMQQHTGQHILSAVLAQSFGYATLSVHLGERYSSIEIAVPSISPFEIVQLEDEANRIICENRPVRAVMVDPEELEALSPGSTLRRPLKRNRNIRIVEIEDIDKIGCGGVHLERTGEVRLIKHLATEKVRGNSRLTFLIGDQAFSDYREKSRISAWLSEHLSAPQEELITSLE